MISLANTARQLTTRAHIREAENHIRMATLHLNDAFGSSLPGSGLLGSLSRELETSLSMAERIRLALQSLIDDLEAEA